MEDMKIFQKAFFRDAHALTEWLEEAFEDIAADRCQLFVTLRKHKSEAEWFSGKEKNREKTWGVESIFSKFYVCQLMNIRPCKRITDM